MNCKILMVEDDPVIWSQLQLLLAGSGYQVGTVGALQRGGFDLCTQMRAFAQVPIFFVANSNADLDELNNLRSPII